MLETTEAEIMKKSMAAAVFFRWVEAVVSIGQFDPSEFGGTRPEPDPEEKKVEEEIKLAVRRRVEKKREEEEKQILE